MQVGVREIPIVIREVDDNEIIEIALIENIQRKDLTPFEESEALQSLATRCSYTHEDMARRLGKSRTAITESLSLNGMPEEVKNLCRLADIHSKSLLLQVVRQGDPQKMVALVEKIAREGGATREAVRKETAKPKAGRPKAFIFSYKAPTKAFKLQLRFTKSRVDRDEVISALEAIIEELERSRSRRPVSAGGSRAAARLLSAAQRLRPGLLTENRPRKPEQSSVRQEPGFTRRARFREPPRADRLPAP